MKHSRAWLVTILISLPVVTTGSNYRLVISPATAATMDISKASIGSVISVGGMHFVKVNNQNVLVAAQSYTAQYDEQYVLKHYQVYGCQNPTGVLQSWTGCSGLAKPAVGTWTQGPCLVDRRDGKTYEIRKYADGKCWMVDNLAYGGDTLWGGTDACVGHPHSGGLFGSRDGTITDFNGTNYQTGHTLRGTFGNWDASGNLTTNTSKIAKYSYGSCAQAYDNSTYKAYEVFGTDGYTLSTTEYDTYAAALAAAGNNTNLVRPRGYHYDWVAATQNPTAYYGGAYDASRGPTNGICPAGWRLPTGRTTSAEWRQLFVAVGGAATGNGGANGETDAVARHYLLSKWKLPIFGLSHRDNSVLVAMKSLTEEDYIWSSDGCELYMWNDTTYPEHCSPYRDYGTAVRCLKD